MDFAKKGDEALSASKYDDAIEQFTKALGVSATAVTYYIKRSTAYQRAKKYPEALSDAETAVALAYKRGSRELIKDAQLRRAISLFFLEQYADARFVLDIVLELDPSNAMAPTWGMKLEAKLKDLSPEEVKEKVTVKKIPDAEAPTATPDAPPKPAKSSESKEPGKADVPVEAPKLAQSTSLDKIKHDWYQSLNSVTINILAKGISKGKETVEIEKDSVYVSFPIEGSSSDYQFATEPLYASIDPTKSKYRITPTKMEITLEKAEPGIKWHNLEGDRKVAATNGDENKPSIPSHILAPKKEESAPAYPTSSKSGVKNWDKVATDDLDDKDDIEGDETSYFFKKLYKDATPEQQRAMMKSYQESGGTVLSTDWSNVGSKTVVPEPPDGMEAKKY